MFISRSYQHLKKVRSVQLSLIEFSNDKKYTVYEENPVSY